ncbi:ribosylnicotinamide kinase [Blastocladiella emersonii ATCC 22665]|nr:ribosylnicotinamide kinase [Blastocladiella emersonii ATCC 22665]
MNIQLIAVGGSSASGKSMLTEQLRRILTPHGCEVRMLRQDTFFLPNDQIPLDPATGEANWELPSAMDLSLMSRVLAAIRSAPSRAALDALWAEHALERDAQEHTRAADDRDAMPWAPPADTLLPHLRRDRVVVLVDGFLLYHARAVAKQFDAAVFVAADGATCRARRAARSGYACSDGIFWSDPPGYFDALVWPAYLEQNKAVVRHLPPGMRVLPPVDEAVEVDEGGKWGGSVVPVTFDDGEEEEEPVRVLLVDSRNRGDEGMRENLVAVVKHIFA